MSDDRNQTLDAIDRKILSLLLENARMSLVDIGERVALSPPAVKRRIERLERQGTVLGYSAVVAQAALGWGTQAFLEVFCAGDTSLDSLRQMAAQRPEVVGAYTVAGDAEAILHLRTADIAHLERTIEHIHSHPHVLRTRTQVVLTTLVERYLGSGRLA